MAKTNLSAISILCLIIITIIIFTTSCNKQSSDNNVPYLVNLTGNMPEDGVKLSDFVEDIRYIKLDASSDNLLSWIYDIKITRDRLFIQTSNKIHIYNWEGEPVEVIDKQGRGPEEYMNILCFDIDTENKSVIILSSGSRLKYYSTENGTFRRSEKLPGHVMTFKVIDANHFYFGYPPILGLPEPLHTIINRSGDTIHYSLNKFLFKSDVKFGLNNEVSSYRARGRVYYSEYLDDTIYSVSPSEGFTPYVIFNKGDDGFTIEKRNSGSEDGFYSSMITSGFFETGEYLFTGLTFKRENSLICYDKNSGTSYLLRNGIENDIDGGLPLKYALLSNDSILISVVDPIELLSRNNGVSQFQNSSNEFSDLISGLSEDDNPILIIYSLSVR